MEHLCEEFIFSLCRFSYEMALHFSLPSHYYTWLYVPPIHDSMLPIKKSTQCLGDPVYATHFLSLSCCPSINNEANHHVEPKTTLDLAIIHCDTLTPSLTPSLTSLLLRSLRQLGSFPQSRSYDITGLPFLLNLVL